MKVGIDVHEKDIAGLLCSGMEGGINYWARIEDYVKPANPIAFCDWGQKDWSIFPHIDYPLTEDGAVMIKDMECHTEGKVYRLDKTAILKGLNLMAEKSPRHFSDFMNQNYDATTGDVFIQYCIFGKVIYG
jgi:hypothetical protein